MFILFFGFLAWWFILRWFYYYNNRLQSLTDISAKPDLLNCSFTYVWGTKRFNTYTNEQFKNSSEFGSKAKLSRQSVLADIDFFHQLCEYNQFINLFNKIQKAHDFQTSKYSQAEQFILHTSLDSHCIQKKNLFPKPN